MKIIVAAVLIGLSSCSFLSSLGHCQSVERKYEFASLFRVEWEDRSTETVDKLTVREDGVLVGSHTFIAPAFGKNSAGTNHLALPTT